MDDDRDFDEALVEVQRENDELFKEFRESTMRRRDLSALRRAIPEKPLPSPEHPPVYPSPAE